jgi:hypothetical protein
MIGQARKGDAVLVKSSRTQTPGGKGKDDRKQNTLARLGESVGGPKTTEDFVLFLELDVEFSPE